MSQGTEGTRSRRSLLAGAMGGLAAMVGSAIGRTTPAKAADANDPNAVHKNVNNATTTKTSITCSNGTSLRAVSSAGSNNSGLFAQASGNSSRGVTGLGVTGVIGQSNSGAGRGVLGFVPGANATGVFGDATSTSGAPVGTFGRSKSPNGFGVLGRNLATTGDAVGVKGLSDGNIGVGVLGHSRFLGVVGETEGSLGVGVFGTALAASSGTGVQGAANHPDGIGVLGGNSATSGDAIGVKGTSDGSLGIGVLGHGKLIGVAGETESSVGAGVLGTTEAASGGVGVQGTADQPNGIGGSFGGSGGAVALEVNGPVRFSSAGIATIASGTNSVTVTPGVDITATSKVLCTLMSDPGGSTTIKHVVRHSGADTFDIVLTANASGNTEVAWFVIS